MAQARIEQQERGIVEVKEERVALYPGGKGPLLTGGILGVAAAVVVAVPGLGLWFKAVVCVCGLGFAACDETAVAAPGPASSGWSEHPLADA